MYSRIVFFIALFAVGAFYYTQWKAGGKVSEELMHTDLSGKTILITGKIYSANLVSITFNKVPTLELVLKHQQSWLVLVPKL